MWIRPLSAAASASDTAPRNCARQSVKRERERERGGGGEREREGGREKDLRPGFVLPAHCHADSLDTAGVQLRLVAAPPGRV